VASIGILYLFGSVRWWLLLTILVPFAMETWLPRKFFMGIYDELEQFWKIDTYKERLSARNREYEGFYFKHLSRYFTGRNIGKIALIGNALLLLMLYLQGGLNIGLLISLTLAVFGSVYNQRAFRIPRYG
jgi:ATP-binding cassette subfamily B protein